MAAKTVQVTQQNGRHDSAELMRFRPQVLITHGGLGNRQFEFTQWNTYL